MFIVTLETQSYVTHGLDGDLCLEEVDVLCEVERVFATVANHVGVQHVISTSKYPGQVRLIGSTLQRAL
jgi:hypothetical protein